MMRLKGIMQRIKSTAGETLTETLCAVLIIVMCFTILCGAIVTAARVNSKYENVDTAFHTTEADTVKGTTASISGSVSYSSIDVTEHTTEQDYVFYEASNE